MPPVEPVQEREYVEGGGVVKVEQREQVPIPPPPHVEVKREDEGDVEMPPAS